MKKSEGSHNKVRENFGSLIFETPPKGGINFKHYFKMDSNKIFFDKLDLSPASPIG